MTSFWRTTYRVQYKILAWLDPLIRAIWRRFGIGNVVELRIAGRNSGVTRSSLVGLLHAEGSRYIGHPNGDVDWTRNLAAAREGSLTWPNGDEWRFRAVPLGPGEEREGAIGATGQHPFPGNLTYRLGRGHVRSYGVYFRLEDEPPAP